MLPDLPPKKRREAGEQPSAPLGNNLSSPPQRAVYCNKTILRVWSIPFGDASRSPLASVSL